MTPAAPAAPHPDFFEILGVERRYAVDRSAMEAQYRKLARQVHPDRFVRADARTKRMAMQRSVEINDAWRVLKDPYRRAEYMLTLSGIDIANERGSVRRAADGSTERIVAPQTLLIEMMEHREVIAEARAAGDQAKLDDLAATARDQIDGGMEKVGRGLDDGGEAEVVAQDLIAVRYWRRLLEELEGEDG